MELVNTGMSDKELFDKARLAGRQFAIERAELLIFSSGDKVSDFDAPNLSGEWADDPTPASLVRDFGVDDGDFATAELVADAWETGVDDVWVRAVQACILRVQGRIAEAIELEKALDAESV